VSDIEIVRLEDVPVNDKANPGHQALLRGAMQLERVMWGAAVKIRLNGVAPAKAAQIIHQHFRRDARKVKTRAKSGYLYIWFSPQTQPGSQKEGGPIKELVP